MIEWFSAFGPTFRVCLIQPGFW